MVGVLGAFVTVVSNWFLIPIYGYLGSAYSTLICYVFMSLMAYFMGRIYYPIPYKIVKILFYLGLSILLVFVDKSIVMEGFLVYLLKGFLLLIFIVFVYFMEKKSIEK